MYIAMNRFQIVPGAGQEFEALWEQRQTRLDQVPGFVEFHLVRGPEHDDHTLYASHTVWESEQAFVDWTHSEAFREAHKNAGDNRHMYIGHPQFEGFTVVLSSAAE